MPPTAARTASSRRTPQAATAKVGKRSSSAAPQPPKKSTKQALLDATERVIAESGIGAITTRRVAADAGVNQALVHYHFGSIENLLLAVQHRVAERVIETTRAHFEGTESFLVKWRRSMEQGLDDAVRKGWPKLWFELLVYASNHPDLGDVYFAHSVEVSEVYRQALLTELSKEGHRADREPISEFISLLTAIGQGILMSRVMGPPSQANTRAVISAALNTEVLETYSALIEAAHRDS